MKKIDIEYGDLLFLLKMLAAAGLVSLSVLIGFWLYRLSAAYSLTLWICLIPAALVLLLIPCLFIKRKLLFFSIWLALSLVLTVPGGICLYGDYIEFITIDTDPPLDIERYLPFQSSEGSSFFNVWQRGFWDEYYPLELELTEDLPVLDGSKYAFPIYSAIVNALYPETTQLNDDHFRFSGSTDSFSALLEQEVDIYFGFTPTQAQLDEAKSRGVELEVTPIVTAPWYFIVHQDNPVEYLTESQVRGIFSGEITNWSEVGGNDEAIAVFQNAPGSESRQLLELFMDDTPLADPVTDTVSDYVGGSHQQTSKYQNHTNSIGFAVDPYNSNLLPPNAKTLYIRSDSWEEGIYEGSDFEAVICAVTRKDAGSENIETILDFITSPEAQLMLMWNGYDTYYYGYDDDPQDDAATIDTAPNIVLEDYMPFRDVTKIVRLDHEASMRLEGDHPRIDGAAAVFPVYSAFVDAVYPEGTRLYINDGKDIDEIYHHQFFNYSNTVLGYQLLAQKDIDIFFGGYPSDEQIAYAKEQGTEFVYTPIGYEAFVFFVHKDNPIDSLTTEQIKGIYSGEITNWSQVGGLDEEIVAYQRNEGSGSQSMLIRFMDGTPIMEPPKNIRVDTMMGIAESVADYRSSTASIGFSFRYYMEVLVNNPDIKLLSIDGVAPTAENIQNGTYPVTGYLYAVSWAGNENENVQKLLDWILSPEGQFIIKETGYTPIGPTE